MASKEQVLGDQTFFVEQMGKTLGSAITLRNGQPQAGDLRAFFKTLANDPHESWKQYNRYAQAFYIHVDMLPTSTPAINWRPGQGGVPMGLRTCDSWDQIQDRNRMGDGTNRRIIDCRGFSFVAASLLGAADWEVKGYRAFLVPGNRDIPWHVAVEVHWTKSQGINDLVVGTQEASDGGCLQERTRGYVNHSASIDLVTWTEPPRPTQTQAFQAALDKDPQRGDPRLAVVGAFPARQSAGSYPPRFVPGSRWG